MNLENIVPDGLAASTSHNVIHGFVNGTAVIVHPLEQSAQYKITLYLDVERSTYKEPFLAYVKSLEETYPFVNYAGYNMKNAVTVNIASQEGWDRDNLTHLIEDITAKCKDYQIYSCCAICGSAKQLAICAVDGHSEPLCESCCSRIAEGSIQTDGSRRRREHLPLGVLGALLGAVVGSALWIVIGQFGFIAGLAGYAIVYGSVKGYEKAGGTVSKKGIILCIIFSLLAIAAAECASLGITIYRELKADYWITPTEAFQMIPDFLGVEEVRGGVIKDLVIGYAFAVWASFSFVKSLWKRIQAETAPHVIERL